MDTTTLSEVVSCSTCHASVRPTDYFCFNCGKSLKPKPPATDLTRQILIYAGSILLPPLGIIWGISYLRSEDQKSKMVGWIAIILTILSLVIAVKMTVDLVNGVNEELNSQLQNFGGF